MKAPFKMKGHTLPGINQRSEGNTDTPDGRSGSSAVQYKEISPTKHTRRRAGHMEAYGEGHTNEDHPNYWKSEGGKISDRSKEKSEQFLEDIVKEESK